MIIFERKCFFGCKFHTGQSTPTHTAADWQAWRCVASACSLCKCGHCVCAPPRVPDDAFTMRVEGCARVLLQCTESGQQTDETFAEALRRSRGDSRKDLPGECRRVQRRHVHHHRWPLVAQRHSGSPGSDGHELNASGSTFIVQAFSVVPLRTLRRTTHSETSNNEQFNDYFANTCR